MPKSYFFSDAHLGVGSRKEDREKERSLIRFLDMAAHDADQLFIVGDLFDYWFEYNSVVPKGYVRLFARLAAMADSGVTLTYLAGNHDFWLGRYLTDEIGITIERDPVERMIAGKRFYIHHGDGLLTGDTGYRILKRILRNRTNIALFSLIHPDLASRIARWSSGKSRQYTSKRVYEGDDMSKFAEQKVREGYDFVVMGHNHVPCRRNIDSGVYVNLGDWITERTYAVFDGTSLELKKWQDG